MRVTFLGTGDAGGVPLYGCECRACVLARLDPALRRRNCSALIESGPDRILLDAGLGDLGERFPPGSLTAIVLTHFHPDHVQGLFHLRWGKGAPIAVYAPPDSEGCADLYKHPGLLEFRPLASFVAVAIGALQVTPVPLIHSKLTFGYAIENGAGQRFAYLTDTAGLPPETAAFLRDWHPHAMALDCSFAPRAQPSRNHNDFDGALASIANVAPGSAWLTHLSHGFDAWAIDALPTLPAGVQIARDDQLIRLAPDCQRRAVAAAG